MKLTKTSWLLLISGVFILVFASLGAIHYPQVHQQNQLNEELASAELRLKGDKLEQLSHRQGELEKRLSQTISQCETAKTILSQSNESIATSETLFYTATAYGVEVTEISSSGLSSGDLEGITCSVLPLTVRVDGDVPNLISFIIKLNSNFMTGTVNSVDISASENTTEERSSANIRLLIYTYQGD